MGYKYHMVHLLHIFLLSVKITRNYIHMNRIVFVQTLPHTSPHFPHFHTLPTLSNTSPHLAALPHISTDRTVIAITGALTIIIPEWLSLPAHFHSECVVFFQGGEIAQVCVPIPREGDGGCRIGEARAGTTSPMPDHKGFKLQ